MAIGLRLFHSVHMTERDINFKNADFVRGNGVNPISGAPPPCGCAARVRVN